MIHKKIVKILRFGVAALVFGGVALNANVELQNTPSGYFLGLSTTKALADVGAEEDPVKTGGDGSGWFWQSQTVTCTVTRTVTWGGGEIPMEYSVSETYQGTKRSCIDGWSLCISKSCS